MNFSLEVWKRSFQGLGSLAAESNNTVASAAAAAAVEDEAGSEKIQTLQEAHATLEKKVRLLETRLTYKEAQLLNFQEKVTSLQSKLEEREREAGEKDRCLEALKKDAESLQQQKVEWTRQEETYVGEAQELVSMLEERFASLENEKERCRGLETSLHERTEALRCKEEEALKLRETNSLIEENVLKLVQAAEMKHEELAKNVSAAESSLRSSQEAVSELQLSGNQASMNLEQANLRIQELELMLGKLVEFSREKDDKLDASEWAVQQLGVHEISRAKASLAQAEKDHLQLQQEVSEMEKELKLKDEELNDVSSFLTRQLRKVETECSALREKLEAQAIKHGSLKLDHEAALSRLDEYEKQLISEQETNLKLSTSVVVFQRDVEAAKEKLKEMNGELERSQNDNKGLIEQMLLLHQNLLDQHENNDLELKCGKRCRTSEAGLNQTHEEAGKNSLVLPPKRQRQCEELV